MIPEGIHWHRTAPPPPICDTLLGDTVADVVIIGAGLTGLRTAIKLAEAGVNTAVLDAEKIGFGSSGRSGGNATRSGGPPPTICAVSSEKSRQSG